MIRDKNPKGGKEPQKTREVISWEIRGGKALL
jgi:hypothetical protein